MSFVERATLNFVNSIRADSGLPKQPTLELGMKWRPRDCPIARSIGVSAAVLPDGIYIENRNYAVPLLVRLFIHRFDNGHYKHLHTNVPSRTMSRDISHLDFIQQREEVLIDA